MNSQLRATVALAFKAVAMAMAALAIAFTALDYGDVTMMIILLSIGLFSHALSTIMETAS
ncbi:MAG: hypothetical protein PVI04_01590 [Anaerolineales bacterium]|jgi:hypothetical protein